MKEELDPLRSYAAGACVMRFCVGVFLGLLIDALLVLITLRLHSLLSARAFHVLLIAIPVVWGTLSMFFLEQMSNMVRDIFG